MRSAPSRPAWACALLAVLGCTDPKPGDTDSGEVPAADTLVREPEVCATPAVTLTADGTGWSAVTEHYRLSIDGSDEAEAERVAVLAETAWQGFTAFFGAEIPGPLEVFVAADEPGFEARLAEDGITEPEGAGGYYEPGNGRAYLFRQPTVYYSHVLLLHELTHQYQDHVSGMSGLPFWYVEGLAEALGRHHWDGDCLELRVRPLLSWEDYAAQAAAELDGGIDLEGVLSGDSGSRPVAQELVRLLTSDPDLAGGFESWRASVAAGGSAIDLDAFAEAVAPIDELDEALAAWIPEDQEPMAPVWLDWVPQGDDAAWGFASAASSAARVKGEVLSFSMQFDAPSGGGVGSVYGYDPATGDIELALLNAEGRLARFAVVGGAVEQEAPGTLPVDAPVTWSQVAGDGVTSVTIGGETVDMPRSLPPAGGLALYAADAQFEAVDWE